MDKKFEVAIVGGGPGGLTLARILQLKGMKYVTVYERDESRFVRGQGGTLDLHNLSGQYALKAAQLMDEFKKYCRYEGQDTRIQDKHGVNHYEEIASDDNNGRPEIDRTLLRDILLDSLAQGTVKWGHLLTELELTAPGKVQLNFENEVKAEADFVVGADGAWSKIRPHLSGAQPIYSGISSVEFLLTDVDACQPEIAKFVGRGQIFAVSDGKGILAQRNSNGIIRVYVSFSVPEDFLEKQTKQGQNFVDVSKTKAFLLEHFQGWNEKLLNLIRADSAECSPRQIYALPVEHCWPREAISKAESLTSKLTLLGDAAHLMSPFGGQGANMAMLDAIHLATALESPEEDFQSALIKFETEMFARSAKAAKLSVGNLKIFFGPNGAEQAGDLMRNVKALLPELV